MKIEFFKHSVNENDIKNVRSVLQSTFLTTGEFVADFENGLEKYMEMAHAIGVTSCTAALQLSMLAWGIGKGDEVITTPMSFCATSNSILHAGASPVFVDVEEDTGNINAELIENKITKNTKAVMPVHLYGQMCDMKRIKQIADKNGLIVIEDAAHCIEGMRDGIRVGQLAEAACLSFYATKSITSGEGGAIVTNNSEKANLLKSLRLHGIDKSAAERYTKIYRHWDMSELGWKYNMDNIQASLLIGQLKRIDQLWKRREEIAKRYEDAFRSLKNVKCMKTISSSKHARHLFTIQVQGRDRDKILSNLQKQGIGVAVNYRPIHLLSYYRKRFGFKEGDFPVAERIGAGTISLPLYPKLKDREVDYVIKSVVNETKR